MTTHIALEGNRNLRDLGGYESSDGIVRRGCLFRSDELCSLTDADLEVIAGLGVRVVFDLRNDVERTLRPSRLWHGVEVHERESPSHNVEDAGLTLEELIVQGKLGVPDDDAFGNVYVDLLTRLAPELRRILELAVDAPARPLLFHCAAGKDRTGIASALLLGLLGVDEETILHDYELTTTVATDKRFAEVAAVVEQHGANADHVRTFLSARRRVMQIALDHIRATWGDFDGYATEALGADGELIEKLRSGLLV